MKISRANPWWKEPFIFDFSGVHLPATYIWFGWWLITWQTSDWSYDGKLHISIDFQPD